MAKTIRSSKDVSDSLAYSLDNSGSILVLIFFASLFVNVFEQSNIGQGITAFVANIIDNIDYLKNYSSPIIIALTADEETELKGINDVVSFFAFG